MIDRSKVLAYLEFHFLNEIKQRHSNLSSWFVDEALMHFLWAVDDKLDHALLTYKYPANTDSNFDVEIDFINKSIFSGWLYRHAKSVAFEKATKHKNTYTQWTDERDAYREADEMSDPAKKLDRDELQRRVEKQLDNFATYLTPYELIIFNEMRQSSVDKKHTIEEIIEHLETAGYGEQTENMIRRVRNILEFRLACLVAHPSIDLFSTSVTIATLNKLGRARAKNRKGYNLRFFGVDRLEDVPPADQLMYVAAGKFKRDSKQSDGPIHDAVLRAILDHDPKAVKAENKPYSYRSKVDLNGIKHDHPVVYIDRTGNAYCHVTKKTRRLTDE